MTADSGVERGLLRVLSTLVGVVVGLTFLFGFGNVLALGLRLGVPVWIAPLVAPAVDVSVVALLLGTRFLALHNGAPEVLRSARRLLLFTSAVTLALNTAEPLLAGRYGEAAFDAVGPLLLIGWAHTGPDLLQAIKSSGRGQFAGEWGSGRASGGVSVAVRDPVGSAVSPAVAEDGPSRSGERQPPAVLRAELLQRARAEDRNHWGTHRRPISADTLRKRLHVGAATARQLVADLRADTHAQLEPIAP